MNERIKIHKFFTFILVVFVFFSLPFVGSAMNESKIVSQNDKQKLEKDENYPDNEKKIFNIYSQKERELITIVDNMKFLREDGNEKLNEEKDSSPTLNYNNKKSEIEKIIETTGYSNGETKVNEYRNMKELEKGLSSIQEEGIKYIKDTIDSVKRSLKDTKKPIRNRLKILSLKYNENDFGELKTTIEKLRKNVERKQVN